MGNPLGNTPQLKIIRFDNANLPVQYHNMIRSKWMRSFKVGSDYFKLADNDLFFEAYNRFITSMIQSKKVEFRLAVLGDDYDTALGFSVAEEKLLHYVHVHKDHRNQGIGKLLLPKTPITTISHMTKKGVGFWVKNLPKAKFFPFAQY